MHAAVGSVVPLRLDPYTAVVEEWPTRLLLLHSRYSPDIGGTIDSSPTSPALCGRYRWFIDPRPPPPRYHSMWLDLRVEQLLEQLLLLRCHLATTTTRRLSADGNAVDKDSRPVLISRAVWHHAVALAGVVQRTVSFHPARATQASATIRLVESLAQDVVQAWILCIVSALSVGALQWARTLLEWQPGPECRQSRTDSTVKWWSLTWAEHRRCAALLLSFSSQ